MSYASPDDTPMRLEQAVAVLRDRFPLTVSMLRTEIRKGRLAPAEVAGKFYVTPAQIRDLFKPCPAEPKAPASTSSNEKAGKPSGSSAMAPMNAAQAALLIALDELRGNSPPTSPPNGRRNRARESGAAATPLRLASSKS